MPPHDLLFKELLTTFLDEFLQLFVPGLWENLERDSLHFVEQETPPVADATHMLRGDLVARARMLGEEAAFLVHVEHDAQPRRSGEVVFRYFTAYRERHRCRVYPILLLSYASPRTPREDAYTEAFPDLEVLRFRYRLIQLNRLEWRDYLRSDNPVAVALMSRMHIAPRDRPLVKAASLRNLVRLGLPAEKLRVAAEFPETYLRLAPEEEEVFRAEIQGLEPEERVMIMQTANQWILKGLEQGRTEGRQEGRLEASRRSLCKILRSRFGEVPPAISVRIDRLTDAEGLERLLDEALACQSLAAFGEALEREASRG
jgi:hypothetical protein